MKKITSVVVPLLLVTAVTGCSDVRGMLGLRRSAPDEFRVISNPPLSIPPDFYLRPPLNGSEQPALANDSNAKNVIFSDKQGKNEKISNGESILLERAGTKETDPNIRQVIEQDLNPPAPAKKPSFFGKWFGKDSKPEDPVIDAGKEKQRILKNKQEGKPANDGDAAIVDESKKSVLQRLLGR